MRNTAPQSLNPAPRVTPRGKATRTWSLLPILLLASGLLRTPARGEVVASAANGFLVRSEAPMAAAPDSVYRALVGRVSDWWDPAHTWSGDPKNLSIDTSPGGCFCERLPDGGAVQHLTTIYASPGKLLRMSGTLGPMQASGLSGTMTWEFKPSPTGTTVVQTYTVGGFYQGDLPELAPIVDSVLSGQLQRLAQFVQTGSVKTE